MAPFIFLFSKTIINFENESISSNVKCFIDDSINCTFNYQGFEVIDFSDMDGVKFVKIHRRLSVPFNRAKDKSIF